MNIRNRVAIVTGAGKVDADGNPRIGNALALALAKQGAYVLVHYSSSKEGAEKTVEEIRNEGGKALAFQANLALGNVGELMMKAAREYFHAPVQILINSAAVFPTDDILTFDVQSAIDAFKIINIGPSLLMQSMARSLPQGMDGVIINIIDARIGNRPYLDHSSYSMAKAAFSQASIDAAAQFAKQNIRVVRINPGAILQAAGKNQEYHQKVVASVPLGREGGTMAITEAALSAINNNFMTGNSIVIDGGSSLV